MKQAPYLKMGATLGMIAPSFGVTTQPYRTRYQASVRNLRRLGYHIVEGENVHLNEGIVSSNTPLKRAEEFMKAYQDPTIDALISVGGGELMNEMLPYVDFEAISKLPPKWFVGYSDNTNLIFPLTTMCDVVSLYAPCATTYYEHPIRLSEKAALEYLSGKKTFAGFRSYSGEVNDPDHPLRRIQLNHRKKIVPHRYEKPFEGTLLGGCLDILLILVGTPFDHVKEFQKRHPEGIIWFLEACDLNPLAIRRGLFSLRQAGWFDNAKGFVFGRPLCQNQDILGVNRFTAVTDMLSDLNVPILMDADLGHIPPVLPFASGAYATVSYADGNIRLTYR